MTYEQPLPDWSKDLDSVEWQTIMNDPRWLDLMRRMAAEVADELALDVDEDAAA